MEFKKICMLGLGYIGLPTASMFATAGLDVVGVFHSHPDHPNRPSEFDREWALHREPAAVWR